MLDGPGQSADLEARGRYLVHAEMCGLCHTEIDRALIYRDDRYLAGGMRVGTYPQGVFISRNLTSDPNTGLGRWSDTEVASAIRDGRSKDGRELNLWGMPWAFFHNLTPDDAQAIARYLKKCRPCRQVGVPRRGDRMDMIRALFGFSGHKTPKQHSVRLKPGCAFLVRQRGEFSEDGLRRRIVPAGHMRPDYLAQRVHQGEGVADFARIRDRAFSLRERRVGKAEPP